MEDFNDMILNCNLHDIGFLGNNFTWNRGTMWQRLDRILFNDRWISTFHNTHIEHLSRTLSDHSPLLLNVSTNSNAVSQPFRFQNMWLLDDRLENIIRCNWDAPLHPNDDVIGMNRLWFKLKRLKQPLRWWNKNIFKNIFSNIKLAENEVDKADRMYMSHSTDINLSALNNAKNLLANLQEKEEAFWKQKASVKFLVEGDRNTSYFHNIANHNKISRNIHKLITPDGEEISNQDLIAASGSNFFESIFNSNFLPNLNTDFYFMPSLITNDDNLALNRIPNEEEILISIKDMNTDSVAGPDGFTNKFFQKFWPILKNDIINAVKDFFEGNPMPKFFTSTTIVLIPKTVGATYWNEFRPISLCTFFNKLISKILVSRMAVFLPKIISLEQTGFVKGRSIFDNVLLAQEMIHDLNAKISGGNVIFKMDISKAYDNLNWKFLYKIMHLFGFNSQYTNLIKHCIENSYFSVLINGKAQGFFKSSNGIRQGDPLSPALFIIAAEFLSRGIKNLFSCHPKLYYKTIGGVAITHLSFADDFILFSNGSMKMLKFLFNFLNIFQQASGLTFNYTKCAFIPAKTISATRIGNISRRFGIHATVLPIKYLGVPLYKGKKRSHLFDNIFMNIQNKLSSWAYNFLSYGGRMVLIKHVLCSIPIYLMHTISPTNYICNKMETIFNKFLWGCKGDKRSIIWSSWSNCAGIKEEGRLGFRTFADMTKTFSHKLWFSFRSNNSLWANFMNVKYCSHYHPLSCSYKPGDSANWKRLCKIKWEAEEFIQWGLGAGNIYFWQDKWLGNFSIDNILNTHSISKMQVKDFFTFDNWNLNLLAEVIPASIIELISKISIHRNIDDCILFNKAPNGKFNTKIVWFSVKQNLPINNIYKFYWHDNIPLTYSFLFWRIIFNYLPVDSLLRKKGLVIVSKCQCCYHFENINHVFINGPIAIRVWNYFDNIFKVMVDGYYESFTSIIKDWIIPIKGHIRNTIPVLICWYLWASRNDSKHNNIRMDAMNIISKFKNKVIQLYNANLIKPSSFKNHYNAASAFGLVISNRKIKSREKLIYWKRPVIDYFKLNTDGSYNSVTAGCGGIIRDHNGKIVVAFAGPSSGTYAITAEIDSLNFGVKLCQSLGFTNIWIEVDALLLIHYISGNSSYNPTNFYKIREIKLALSGMNYSISHILREGNAVADALAKLGCNLDCFYHFNDASIPRNIKGLINLDRMGLPYMRSC
ncbi:hypothetical protein KFK09_012320 [Dendrobium nobile]|uniref:Reverse transcriptase domain-containing protein n=1 Tax=Dendrobium nobile TaxID=94219 RepID=A0A8T3BKF9_DENNO|nr:hypothetical protein KFK09_012320 [Dendrobium nobile]